jgi:hypothetical protein
LGVVNEGVTLTDGWPEAPHVEGCPASLFAEFGVILVCDCDFKAESWDGCDGCGSPVPGARHALTMWVVADA